MIKLQSILFVFVYGLALSCNSQNATPKEYKYFYTISKDLYKNHMVTISDSIRNRIKLKVDPYYQTENDSLTEIIVDTILYSPKKDKFAFFVITKNSDDKLLDKGKKNEFHFDAHCFIGHLANGYKIIDIAWVGGHNLSNYNTLENTSNRIREIFFGEITERTNSKGESTYKYNFDDVRFW